MRKPVVMIIADHTARTFSVQGPMMDDSKWTNAVAKAIDSGRNVNCSTAEITAEQAAKDYIRDYGYKQVPSGSIVTIF